MLTIAIVAISIYATISVFAGLFGVGVGMGLRGSGLALVQGFFLFLFMWPVFLWYSIVTK